MNTFSQQKFQTFAGNEFQTARGYIRRMAFTDPAAVSATATHAAIALTAAEQDITSGITNPTYPRNVTVKGNASGVAGDVVITGTNYRDAVITETIALNGATEVLGNKAFKTITNIHLPVETHAGTDTVSVGRGKKFGLDRLHTEKSIIAVYVDTAPDSALPTMVISSSAIESNTAQFATDPDASKDFVLYSISRELRARN